MNPLLKKEIRLLLPAWGLTVLLALGSVYFGFGRADSAENFLGGFSLVMLGALIMCASSFGREFSLGTFSMLMVQPVSRKKFWMMKAGVLAAALALVFLVFSLCALQAEGKLFSLNFFSLARLFASQGAFWVYLILLTGISGGLWMALVIRQMMAVIWLVALVPGLLCVPLVGVLSHFGATDETVEATLFVVLSIYSVAGIAGSWLILRRAQDVPWTGGTITLPDWMTAQILRRSTRDERLKVPWRALIRKEFYFNQVLLFGLAGLFLLDLGEVGVRFLRRHSPGDFNSLLQGLGMMLWLLMPLIIGCTSIAEERKMGTLEGQLCLPVPARRQFLVKFCFVLIFGGVLSTLLPALAECVAVPLGLDHDGPDGRVIVAITAAMGAIALISFFASSLARNVLQALPLALGMIVGICFAAGLLAQYSGFAGANLFTDFMLWNPVLPELILAVLLPVTLVWLAWRNFRCLHETAQIWRRNSLALTGVLAFTIVASLVIYHRAWEKLTPFEPAHGMPRWTLSEGPPSLQTGVADNLLISLPDGRHWFGCVTGKEPSDLNNESLRFLHEIFSTWTRPGLKAAQLSAGSDWVSLAPGYVDNWEMIDAGSEANGGQKNIFKHVVASRETVAIRSDGTLWVSEKDSGPDWNTNTLVQFGTENDWQQVLGDRMLWSVLLLKKDGTLWRWGRAPWWTTPPSPGADLRAQTPGQISTNSDWEKLLPMGWSEAVEKKDGSVWNLWHDDKTRRDVMVLNTNLALAGLGHEPLDEQKISRGGVGLTAGIRPDGTLWVWGDYLYVDRLRQDKFAMLRSGPETNWVAVALGNSAMVALKSDGTLWGWGGKFDPAAAETFTRPPMRLGIHDDWTALAQTDYGVVSLAADGSLWLWPETAAYRGGMPPLIEPPQKPVALGNVLAE